MKNLGNIKYKVLVIMGLAFFALFLFIKFQDLSWEANIKKNLEKMVVTLTQDLKPWKVPNAVFKVEAYGALADGETINTRAIQKAIDECSAKGGGVVLFSKGDYVTGTIELKSGVMLEVAKEARILGSLKLEDYPEKIEEFKSVMSENHKYRQSLIYAEKCDKVGIRGQGEIYFRGEEVNFPGPETPGEIIGRPFGIRMIQCKNVVLQDIYLHNAAAWMQSYLFCQDLIFDGLKVENQANYNNDGLDLDGCTNVIVRNCYINSEDDAMCLKGASQRPSQNILIENSTFVSSCNALKIGTDTQGDFRNIVARNLVLGGIPDSRTAIKGHQAITGITLASVDGGQVESILISEITINQAQCPVFIGLGNRLRVMPGAEKPAVGYLKNIVIENVSGERNFRQGSLILGIKDNYIEDVVIRNYKITMEGGGDSTLVNLPVGELEGGYPDAHGFSSNGLPAYGFYIRHAKRINFIDTKITPLNPDQRPAFKSGGDTEKIIANNEEIK